MRKLTSIVFAAVVALLPFAAAAEEPVWVAEPRGVYWNFICGEKFPFQAPMSSNLSCTFEGRQIGKTDGNGIAFLDVRYMYDLWLEGRILSENPDVLIEDDEVPTFLQYRSNFVLPEGHENWSLAVNQYEFAELCKLYDKGYAEDGFFPLWLYPPQDDGTRPYGPVCISALGTNISDLTILGGMLEDGTWYINRAALEAVSQ